MKVAVIIGGSAGIGQAAAAAVARQEYGVILTYRSHPEGADEVVAAIAAEGGTAVALPLDVGESASFPAFAEQVRAVLAETWQTDRIDALVNNAGVGEVAMLGEITDEHYDKLNRVLLKGPLFLTQALLPLVADGAAIVNTTSSSTHATGATPGYSVYAAMKGGLVVLTRYLAKELAVRGIRVNSVSPGVTRTRLGGDAFEKYPELIAPQAARTALGRIGEPADVGDVIAFLVTDQARWITGQDIEVSGGWDL
ncbi:SDR family NAD(P)-dependent oxidoreductase [Gryllotalpicola protaetiae]|uniref:SDR family oxidoreductase n=1 Tax=Gryllotalpicola protaetiae TaxID=2419771 RepID=A0A387BKE9_9MICO|nr:SDR family oxidoreductase [Gryllotalpicola protaetiae]AYG04353.1 SDR family oxidoreductase [Gryllotalpicola protaetiae]